MISLNSEILFGEYLSSLGGTVLFSNKDQDMFEHWDVAHVSKQGFITRFDVKATPNKESVPYNSGMRWVEVKNVNGDSGWLEGAADYIVFEDDNRWILVNREKLLKQVNILTSGNTFKKEFKTKPMPYRWHTREGRKDLTALVPVADLVAMGVVIKKP